MPALPANIRVNAQVPFPSLVVGSGPVTITKQNGIWTVGFSINTFGSQNPPIGNYPTDFLLAWDSVAQTFFKVSITNLQATTSVARLQRSATSTPITVVGTDQIINCNISSGPAACALPTSASRNGQPLTFKDLGQAAAYNITITPNGVETIDGVNAAVVIKNNFGWITLVPFNDGVNTGGWMIQ